MCISKIFRIVELVGNFIVTNNMLLLKYFNMSQVNKSPNIRILKQEVLYNCIYIHKKLSSREIVLSTLFFKNNRRGICTITSTGYAYLQ